MWNRCSDAKGAVEDHAADLVSSSVSIAVGAAPKTTDLVEIAGANRVETAIAMAMKAFPSGADAVVLATAYNWPDALGGSALAGAVDGPMLLVGSDPTPVLDAIDDLGATKAYILGGTGAVSGAVEDALVATLGADNVTRIAGGNRYETASLVADKVIELAGGAYDGTAFFATGANFPDALAASPLAAAKIWPVYLVAPGATTATVNDAVTSGIILGGPGVVSGDFAIDGVTMTRLAGDNRYETAAAVAAYGVDTAGLGWNKVALTLGTNYPDALAGGVLQGKDGSVLLLTPGTTLDPAAEAALSAHKDDITEVRFFGGTSVISQAVRDAVRDILN
ncbi:n-acetylmuramoyl-L-alanine amidase cwlB precursor [Coriobacteriaceae bacterium EMTCatB1]|nr:n-acetylmuramoyl-L-alanine amidase cwlB precursor [Coriobacteriaceae bacterium EMTCatB1]